MKSVARFRILPVLFDRPSSGEARSFSLHALVGLIAFTLLLASNSRADSNGATDSAGDGRQAPMSLNPDSFYGKDSTTGVFVRDSAVAMERFSLAKKMQDAREWAKSADIYQEIIDKYADRVVPSQVDSHNNIYQYTSVTEAVRQQLCRWPEDGLRVYDARFEATADDLLNQAGRDDLAALHNIVSTYFVTDAGKKAAMRLIGVYFERGEFAAAAWLGDRLLQWHPNVSVERPALLYRTGLADSLCGDDGLAADRLAELRDKYPSATGVIAVKDTLLATALAAAIATPAATPDGDRADAGVNPGVTAAGANGGGTSVANGNGATGVTSGAVKPADAEAGQSTAEDSWNTFGGDESRGMIPVAGGRPGARLYSAVLSKPSWAVVADAPTRHQLEQADRTDRLSGAALGVMPVASRGQLFFQDNTKIYGLQLDSGVTLPGWAATYPNRDGKYAIDGWGMPRDQQMAVTLTDSRVLAILNQSDRVAAMQGVVPPDRAPRLVCLDRATGRQVWSATADQIPASAGAFSDVQFGGCPLVVGENVYIVGRGGRGTQFENAYVLCFDLNGGRFKWSCYVASANNPMAMYGNGAAVASDFSSLAYSSGRLYCITNLGAVAALDAYSGSVVWLNIYHDGAETTDYSQQMFQQQPPPAGKPWTYNPAVVKDGKFFAMPSDSKSLFVYDASTGVELKKIARGDYVDPDLANAPDASDIDTLLGVWNDKIIVTSDNRVCCIDWKQYDHDAGNPALFWAASLLRPGGGDAANDTIRGRGFITSDSVFVATAWQLYRIALRTGKVTERYPAGDGHWSTDEGPGNVLVTQDQVVIAGDRAVSVYTDLDMARAKLDRAVADAPTDPSVRLRYAEVMFAGSRPDVARQKLDEAIDLIGGVSAMRPGEVRSRVFTDALTFATRISSTPDRFLPDLKNLAQTFFDRAAAAADTPARQVSYRVARAHFATDESDMPTAVRLYQEILADASTRNVAVGQDAGNSTQAGLLAEKELATLLLRPDGVAAYASYEQAAADKLSAARAADDAPQLLRVAQLYPNSRVAADAMLAAADAYEAHDNPRQATRVLRQIYLKYPDTMKDRVLESMARNYLRQPGRIDAATSRLSQAAREFAGTRLAKPLTLPDGSTISDVTFADAAEALKKFSGRMSAVRLPDFHLPTRAQWSAYHRKNHKSLPPFLTADDTANIDNVQLLIPPVKGFERNDRVAVWATDTGVRLYGLNSAKPLGVAATFAGDAPKNIAWTDAGAVVWSGKQLALLKADDAQVGWSVRMDALPGQEIVADADSSKPDDDAADAGAAADGEAAAPMPNAQFINPNFIRRRFGMPPGFQAIQMLRAQAAGGGNPAGAAIAGAGAGPDASGPADVETIDQVVVAGDRVIASTSIGRIMAIDLADGGIAWQTRLADRAASNLVANDDFTCLRILTDTSCQLVVIDTYSGTLLARKSFAIDQGNMPLNIALAADGTLVWTQPDRICIKDLYEKGLDPTRQSPASADNMPIFVGATRADQLLVSNGTIAVVADNGQFIHLYSLETGLLRHNTDNGQDVECRLATNASDWNVSLLAVGQRLYGYSPKTLVSYNIDHPDGSPILKDQDGANYNFEAAFPGQDYLIMIDQPLQRITEGNKALPYAMVQAFSRTTRLDANGIAQESGVRGFADKIADPAGITAWQAVDGGLAYVSGDQKLHWLRGAREMANVAQ